MHLKKKHFLQSSIISSSEDQDDLEKDPDFFVDEKCKSDSSSDNEEEISSVSSFR